MGGTTVYTAISQSRIEKYQPRSSSLIRTWLRINCVIQAIFNVRKLLAVGNG